MRKNRASGISAGGPERISSEDNGLYSFRYEPRRDAWNLLERTACLLTFVLIKLNGKCQSSDSADKNFTATNLLCRHILTNGNERWAGVEQVRDSGAPWVSWVLLVVCFMLAVPASVPETDAPASAPAQVEAEPEETDMPVVALTFDDGPRSSTTGRLLDELALREVPATFFLLGHRIPGNEDLVRRMAADGHQIGVHTYDHVEVTGLSREDFDLQVGKTRSLLLDILGEREFWLRPPYGITDAAARQWADSPIVLWSVDPEDWKDQDVGRIVAGVVEHVQDGDIILMHDLYGSSVDAAVQIVDALLEKGYCFVTVEDLLARNGIEAQDGVIYRSGRK